jgi:hypothetical protein
MTPHPDDDVPRLVADPVPADGGAEVVRREQRGERDHDHVVEEQHPAGEEARLVVEARRTNSAAPPVSGMAADPSA